MAPSQTESAMNETLEDQQARIEKIKASSSYRQAHIDAEFLSREALRPIRLQLELLKPEIIQEELGVQSTVVVFGGTRIVPQEEANQQLQKAQAELDKNPEDPTLQRDLRIAKNVARKAPYYEEARRFGNIVSSSCQIDRNCDYVVVTGGGPGIMEAANRGAHDVGAKSIGLNITLPFEQEPNSYISPELCFEFKYFAIRKMHFLMRAKAMVAFPGGYGTMDELFETLTLIQTQRMDPIPVILFGKEFWDKLVNFENFVEEGTISPKDLELFSYAETAEEAWQTITEFHRDRPQPKLPRGQ